MSKAIFRISCMICCIWTSLGGSSRYLYDTNKVQLVGHLRQPVENGTTVPGMPMTSETVVFFMTPAVCECSDVYDPVCATNEKSYFNQCQMECEFGPNADVTVAHQGNCIPY